MKKHVIFFLLLMMMAPVAVSAQEQTQKTETKNRKDKTVTIVEETPLPDGGKIVTTTIIHPNEVFVNGFLYNWELTVDGGAQMYFGENDSKSGNQFERVAPRIDLMLTKWASPSFGLGLGVSGGRFKGLYQSIVQKSGMVEGNYQTDVMYHNADPKWDYMKLANQRGTYMDVYALFHVDAFNMFGGYKADRPFTVDMYAGGGVLIGFDKRHTVFAPGFNLGFAPRVRLNHNLSLAMNVQGALISDDFDGELYINEPDQKHWDANHKMDGNLGVTVGLVWDIGKEKSRWRTASRVSQRQYAEKVIVKKEIAEQPVVAPVVVVDKEIDTLLVTKVQVPETWFHINFVVDRWDIRNREMINLQSAAELIKNSPGVQFLVCGYADKQTATPEHNQMLSEKRSEAVYNTLVNEFGVDPAQLVVDAKGGVDYMFYNEKELSRCVLITAIQP